MTYSGVLCPSWATSLTMAPWPGYLIRLNLLPADVSLHENRIFSGTPDPLKDQLQQLTACMHAHSTPQPSHQAQSHCKHHPSDTCTPLSNTKHPHRGEQGGYPLQQVVSEQIQLRFASQSLKILRSPSHELPSITIIAAWQLSCYANMMQIFLRNSVWSWQLETKGKIGTF